MSRVKLASSAFERKRLEIAVPKRSDRKEEVSIPTEQQAYHQSIVSAVLLV